MGFLSDTFGGIVDSITGRDSLKAAREQSRSVDRAADVQKEMFDESVDLLAPQRETGNEALYSLADLFGVRRPTEFDDEGEVSAWSNPALARENALAAFRVSPGYQFRLDQGRKALENSAASRGMLKSGNMLKALTEYGQGVGSQEFDRYANRLASLAGVGQSATGQQVGLTQAQGGALADLYTQKGNARASGYVGQGNALRGLISGATKAFASGGFGG